MSQRRKFYYIDGNGNKTKYAGKIIENEDGTFNGIITTQSLVYCDMKLEKHPKVDSVEGYSSYYTYTNFNNEEERYYSIVKKDEKGNNYFTYSTQKEIKLIVHPTETIEKEYYTYTVNNEEKLWTGKVEYIKNAYYGIR